MVEASILVAEDQFSCSICLDLLKDPVTIPCGHSYCMSCITDCWNKDDQEGVYSCPQCRQTFTPKPALNKNVVFAEIVEKLKKTKVQTAPPAEPGDVECDVCSGKKLKAVKSCLMCLNSYCQSHLEQHDSFFKDKRHHLINATGRLKEMICSQHDRLMEVYCRTDQRCICFLCTMDEQHTNHHTVSTKAERTEKQKLLGDIKKKFQKRIQEREKELQKLKEAVKTHKRSAQAAVESSERSFTELIRSIERSRSEVTQMIRDREKATVSRAEGLLKRLEQEIDDLRRRDAELKQLSHTDNHIHFLQSFQSLSVPPASTDSISVSPLVSYDDIGKSVTLLRGKLEDLCNEEIKIISGRVTYIEVLTTTEPKSRDEFLQYSPQLTLDSNTAHKYIRLSEGNKVATFIGADQQYPVHPDRFHDFFQVLCRESVCGRSYWEVEWSGGVGISVSYKSISRKGDGDDCVFGFDHQSWRLSCSDSGCAFRHNKREIELPVVLSSSRIGVYVDHSAGILSFYRVSHNTMALIHRVQTTFSQPLYPGFGINLGSTLKLSS